MKDVTPKKFKCWPTHCPAILEAEDGESQHGRGHFIIGKKVDLWPQELAERVGKDEFLVWVPKGMVKPGDD
jgi:hypothetical protein